MMKNGQKGLKPQDEVLNQLRIYIEEDKTKELNDFLTAKENENFDINYIFRNEFSKLVGNKVERSTFRVTQFTLLHISVRCKQSSESILEILINHHADPNIPYCRRETITTQLYDGYEGKPTAAETTEKLEEIYTPVELACKECCFDKAKYLIRQGGCFNQEKTGKDLYLELAPIQIQYLQAKNQQIKLLEEKKEVLEKVQEIYQYDGYKTLTVKNSHFNSILKIQALARGHLSRKKTNRNKLKRKKLDRTEKLGIDIVGQLMKKRALFDFALQATSRQPLVSSKINHNQQRLETTSEIGVLRQKYHNIAVLKLSLCY